MPCVPYTFLEVGGAATLLVPAAIAAVCVFTVRSKGRDLVTLAGLVGPWIYLIWWQYLGPTSGAVATPLPPDNPEPALMALGDKLGEAAVVLSLVAVVAILLRRFGRREVAA